MHCWNNQVSDRDLVERPTFKLPRDNWYSANNPISVILESLISLDCIYFRCEKAPLFRKERAKKVHELVQPHLASVPFQTDRRTYKWISTNACRPATWWISCALEESEFHPNGWCVCNLYETLSRILHACGIRLSNSTVLSFEYTDYVHAVPSSLGFVERYIKTLYDGID